MKKSSTRPHLPYLDGIRGICSLLVVIHHAFLTSIEPLYSNPTGLMKILFALFGMGHVRIDIFVVLSGFSLMLPVACNNNVIKGGIKQFFERRARRIVPPYVLCILASLVLIYVIPQSNLYRFPRAVTIEGIITHLLFIHDWWPETSNKINPVLWSMAVEWRNYLLFPLLVILWRKFGPLVTTALFCGFSFSVLVVLQALNVTQVNNSTGICPQYIGLFAMGALAATIAFSDEQYLVELRNRVRWEYISIVGVFLFLVTMKYPTLFGNKSVFVIDYIIGITTVCSFIFFTRKPEATLCRFLSTSWLLRLGTIGYSIYLMHMPLQVVFLNYGLRLFHLSPLMQGIALMTVGTVVVILGCFLFYWFCERPFIGAPKKKDDGTPPRQSSNEASYPVPTRVTPAFAPATAYSGSDPVPAQA